MEDVVSDRTQKNRQGRSGVERFGSFFSQVRPILNRGIMVRGYDATFQTGVISAAVRRTDDRAVRFFCKTGLDLGSVATPLDLTNTAGLTELHRMGGGQIFQSQDVPVSAVPAAATGLRLYIGIGSYSAAGARNDHEEYEFIAVPQVAVAKVESRACLFFAYNSDAAAFPYAQENIPETKPYSAVVPIDAGHVWLSVPKNGSAEQVWTHSGGGSGVPLPVPAFGEWKTDQNRWDADNTDAAYSSNALGSLNIRTINSDNGFDDENRAEGLLAAMWDFGAVGMAPRATDIIPVGTGMKENRELLLSIDAASDAAPALNLLFGSHQENRWHAASGFLQVKVQWR